MKKLLLFTVFFFVAVFGYAQNLVPNAGFENYSTCPTNEDQAEYATGWFKCSSDNAPFFGNTTPDYYNSCSSASLFGVPQGGSLYQPDLRACGAYMGLITYSFPTWTDYREQVSVQLTQPLVIGQKYYLSFSTVMGGQKTLTDFYDHPSNNIGMRLSTIAYNPSNPAPIDNFSHLRSAAVINDTMNWINISGSIIADSAYNFLMLGNFYNDANTDTLMYNCPTCHNYYSYYVVDNICVSTDSLYCNSGIYSSPCTVSINELNDENKIKVFPNPSTDLLTISFENAHYASIQITDVLGNIILDENAKNRSEINLNISHLPSGLYFLKLNNQQDSNTYSKKILKL